MKWILSLCSPAEIDSLDPSWYAGATCDEVVRRRKSSTSTAYDDDTILVEKEVLITESHSADNDDDEEEQCNEKEPRSEQPSLSKRTTFSLAKKMQPPSSADREARERDEELHRRDVARRSVIRTESLRERERLQRAEQARRARWEDVHGSF